MNKLLTTLPRGWVMAAIEDLFAPLEDGRTLHQGWSPRCENGPSETEEDWGVLKTTAIQPGAFLPEHNKRLPAGLPPRPRIEVRPGDILITCAGPRNRCGIACLVRNTRRRLMMSGKMYRFRVPSEELESRYLEAYLQTATAQRAIDGMKTGGSDSGLNLTHDRFRRFEVPVAPLNEQRRIVAKIEELFSDLDAGVEALKKAKAQLKLYRQAVLKAAFEGRLTAARREGHKVDKPIVGNSNLIQENASDLSTLSRGWGWAKLNSVCNKIQDGSHFSPKVQYDSPAEGRYLYITAKNIKENGIDLSNVTYIDYDFHKSIFDRCNPEKDDVLLIKDGVKTGIAAINQLEKGFSLLSSVALFKTKKMVLLPYYLKHYLNSPVGFRMITGQMTGTAIKRIILDKLRTSYIPLAPIPEQQKIVEEIERLLSIAIEVENSIDRGLKQSRIIRQSILKKAFQGELVRQDPEDKPAAELLERIKREKAGHAAGKKAGRRAVQRNLNYG